MTGLVATVLSKIPESCTEPCTATVLNKERCNIRLARTSSSGPRLIIDLDEPSSHWDADQGRRCDYLFLEEVLGKPSRVRPIELKGSSFHTSTVVAQLQAGANVAERLIPSRFDVDLQTVLASRSLPKSERKALGGASVRFRGKERVIKRIRCGDLLP